MVSKMLLQYSMELRNTTHQRNNIQCVSKNWTATINMT